MGRVSALLSIAVGATLLAGCALSTPHTGVAGVDVDCARASGRAQAPGFGSAGMAADGDGSGGAAYAGTEGRMGVVWVRDANPRDHRLSAAWCATVGEPVIRDRAVRLAAASESDVECERRRR